MGLSEKSGSPFSNSEIYDIMEVLYFGFKIFAKEGKKCR